MPSRGRDNSRRRGRVSLTGLAGTFCRRGPSLALLALASSAVPAFTVDITAGARTIYLQIGNGTSSGFFDNGVLSSTNTTVNPAAGTKVINRDAKWTYGYANAAVVPGGIYGGAGGTNNGRVTYTAVLP